MALDTPTDPRVGYGSDLFEANGFRIGGLACGDHPDLAFLDQRIHHQFNLVDQEMPVFTVKGTGNINGRERLFSPAFFRQAKNSFPDVVGKYHVRSKMSLQQCKRP
jgi:hypothetical protein